MPDFGPAPGPYAVWAEQIGPLRLISKCGPKEASNSHPASQILARLDFLSGAQLRTVLSGAKKRELPGRLMHRGIIAGYEIAAKGRMLRIYGPGQGASLPGKPGADALSAINQVVANQLWVRLCSLREVKALAFLAVYGRALEISWTGRRFTVISFREGGKEEERFSFFLRSIRPEEGRLIVIGTGWTHISRLAQIADRALPIRLTCDGALFNLPLERAFCKIERGRPVRCADEWTGEKI